VKRRRPSRTRGRGAATRERLLEAARVLFSREGYAAVSLADVARRAKCSLSTAYYHFPDKRALLLRLIDDWGKAMPVQRRAAFDIKTALDGHPRRAARDFLKKSLAQLERGPSFYRAILAEADRDADVRHRYEGASRAITVWLTEMMHLGQQAGIVRAERKAEPAAFLLHHVMESVLTELIAQNVPPEQREEIIDELTEMIVGYMTKL
jgi:AcrR family transcriptional regulator